MVKRIGLPLLALALATTAPAGATGTLRIQQNNDAVQNYTNVTMRIVNKTLMLTSADKVSTVVIKGASCAHTGDLVRCTGGAMSLQQGGKTREIPFKSATFYFNLTDNELMLPLSTMKLAAHCVVFAARTDKGTYITGTGRLDEEPSK